MVFLTEDQKLAREGMYAVRMDPQFWYDQALERVFEATNEFEVLGPRPGSFLCRGGVSSAFRFATGPRAGGDLHRGAGRDQEGPPQLLARCSS